MTGQDFLDKARREGALVSGPPVPGDFKQGWGTHPFMRGMKAHRWTAGAKLADGTYGIRSACGRYMVVTTQVPLLQPGNLPFCALCENRLMRLSR